jgi:hypothetical protein
MRRSISTWFQTAAATIGVVAAVVLTDACDSSERRERWVADSTSYAARLGKWLRDSAVVDSVARTVDITEMVQAFHKLVTAPQPLDEAANVSCARLRIFWDYGSLAADIAGERARDSVKHLLGQKAFDDATARTPEHALVPMPRGFSKCRGKEVEHRKSVGTTPLDTKEPRPLPPRGWPR